MYWSLLLLVSVVQVLADPAPSGKGVPVKSTVPVVEKSDTTIHVTGEKKETPHQSLSPGENQVVVIAKSEENGNKDKKRSDEDVKEENENDEDKSVESKIDEGKIDTGKNGKVKKDKSKNVGDENDEDESDEDNNHKGKKSKSKNNEDENDEDENDEFKMYMNKYYKGKKGKGKNLVDENESDEDKNDEFKMYMNKYYKGKKGKGKNLVDENESDEDKNDEFKMYMNKNYKSKKDKGKNVEDENDEDESDEGDNDEGKIGKGKHYKGKKGKSKHVEDENDEDNNEEEEDEEKHKKASQIGTIYKKINQIHDVEEEEEGSEEESVEVLKGAEENGPGPKFVYREDWGAPMYGRGKAMDLPAKYVWFIYSTDYTTACYSLKQCTNTLRQLERKCQATKNLQDIPFNFLIGGDGRVYEGRGWELQPPRSSINPLIGSKRLDISFIGNKKRELIGKKMMKVAEELVEYGVENGYISPTYTYKEWDKVGKPFNG